jgi:hypothetical protein
MYLLLILTGLVLVSLADAGESHRAALREHHHSRALSAAERAIAEAVGSWDVRVAGSIPIGESSAEVESAYPEPPWPLGARVRVTRLGERMFWVGGIGSSGAGGDLAERRVALLVEHLVPNIGEGVIRTAGELEFGPGFTVEADADSGCAPGVGEPVVAAPDSRVAFRGDSIATRRDASPAPLALGEALDRLGSGPSRVDLFLAAGSILSLPFAAERGAGHPPPVVVAEGDLTLTGGTGEAFLVVRGRLHIEGGARLRGVVVAERGLIMTNPATSITGTIVLSRVSSALLDEGRVIGSGCATRDALAVLATPAPVGRRGWVELW